MDQIDINEDYLNEIYGDDMDIRIIMFSGFLNESYLKWILATQLISDEQLEEARDLIHQIKPSFSFVGLTDIQQKLDAFEKSLHRSELSIVEAKAISRNLNDLVLIGKKKVEEKLEIFNSAI